MEQAEKKYAIGLDIGTTTISLVVVDRETGEMTESCTIENNSFLTSENSWEKIQDPHIIRCKALELLKEYRKKYPDLASIGLTGQMHGIVYLNAEGECISPLYTWQDGSGDVVLADLEEREGAQETADDKQGNGKKCKKGSVCQHLNQKYGIPASTGYGLITYLYHCKTDCVPQDAAKVCTIMDYLGMVLTGRKEPLMHSSNAASLGLYELSQTGFMAEILEKEGGSAKVLPKVTETFALLGCWDGIPVSVALGDNQASFLGSVTDADHSILVNMGTGGQVSVLVNLSDGLLQNERKSEYGLENIREAVSKTAVEIRPFAPGKYLLAGSSLCGGRAYAMLKNFFAEYAHAMGITDCDHYAVMNRILDAGSEIEPEDAETAVESKAESAAEGDGLQVIPTFSGTRQDPKKRGTIANIGIHNFTPAALIYGTLDGMAQELWQMYKEIADKLGISRTHMVASGNGIRKNPHLQKIFSSKFGMRLQLAAQEEEAAYGAARAGLIAAGHRGKEPGGMAE